MSVLDGVEPAERPPLREVAERIDGCVLVVGDKGVREICWIVTTTVP